MVLVNKPTAYIMDPSPEKEIEINVQLLDRAVKAAEHLAPNLQFVVLPTGTKVITLIKPFSNQSDTPRPMVFILSKSSRLLLRSPNL